jgi:hypothetical protein
MSRTFLIAATLLLSLATAQARDHRHIAPVIAVPPPLVATGYPPRYGPHPYYDAGFVWGLDGFNRDYYDGWRTRPPWYASKPCGLVAERRITQSGRVVVQNYCVE